MATPADTLGVATTPAIIAVIGAGYVGVPTAVLFAHFGHRVVAAESDEHRRTMLAAGRSPILEEGLEPMLSAVLESGRLSIVAEAAEAVRGAQFVFLCVATPTGPDGRADLSEIDIAVDQIRDDLAPGAIVVNKSTVPVGTVERVSERLARHDVFVVSNPEFLREGTAIRDSFNPDRTVVGGDADSANAVGALFAPTGAPLVVTDARSAELIKYASNTFLVAKLSFANSIAELCDAVGADAAAVVGAMGADPRIGASFLNPGPGWGGPCLPKDAAAMLSIARDAGVELPVLAGAVDANERALDHVAARVSELCGGDLRGRRVCVLGLTFKANTNDRRVSPSLSVIRRLRDAGADLVAYDPTVSSTDDSVDLVGVRVVDSLLDAVREAVIVVVLTEWPEFAIADLAAVAAVVGAPTIYDVRGIIDVARASEVGLRVVRLGRTS